MMSLLQNSYMRRIKTKNINTKEFWNTFATESYMNSDINRGGSVCKFNTVHDLLNSNKDMLDIGCLNGNLYNFLIEQRQFNVKSFTGIDLSEKLIELAKSRFPDQQWIQGNSNMLPFEDNLFDVVTILEMLEHLDDPRSSLKEAFRVCKPFGYVIVSVPNELKIEDPSHVWSFTTTELFELLSEFSINVQILQTCSNNRNIIGKAIKEFDKYI